MSAALAIQPPLGSGHLRLVRFTSLDAWAYEEIFAPQKSRSSFPIVNLGEVISQRKGFIRIDDNLNYKRCRVQLRAQGVVLRDEVAGTKIKTKSQQVCRAGDFLVAEIDAKLGGFGIIPAELASAVVSSHYFLFDIDESLLSRDFLALCLTTDYFQQQVKATGSTNYAAIRPHHVLNYCIPLPSLPVQNEIVERHRAGINEAETAESRAREADLQVVRFLEESLGLKPRAENTKLASNTLHFARFATLERWGEIFHGPTDVQSGAKFPMVSLRDVIADLQNGWSPKCHDRPASPDEWGVLKLGAVTRGEFDDTQSKALPAVLKPNPKYEIRQGDVLITRGSGALALVASCVFVKSCRPLLLLPDLIFRVVFTKEPNVVPQFLAEVLRSPIVRHQIEVIALGASTTMKKVTKPTLFNLQFPLPPLPEQKRIVTELERLRAEARAARATAAACREAAAKSFHVALFAQ